LNKDPSIIYDGGGHARQSTLTQKETMNNY